MAQWTSSDAETRPALSDQEWLASHRRACNYSRGHRRNRLGMTGPRRYRRPSSILPRREGPAAWRLGTGREPGAGHGLATRDESAYLESTPGESPTGKWKRATG